jgi:hypothetical protein
LSTFRIARRLTSGEITVNISGNSPDWIDSVSLYLSLLPAEGAENGLVVNLELHVCKEDNLDEVIPLPGEDFLTSERTLLVDRPVSNLLYSSERKRWIDYKGFGRFKIDSGQNLATAAHLENSGISQVYADIALGYNPLLGLLAGHGYYSVHASCSQIGGKGILFTGIGGSGKSTAAYALLRSGHPILTDDRIMLKEVGENSYRAVSVSDVMKLDHKALENFFPEMKNIKPLHRVGDEYYYKAGAFDGLPYLNSSKIDYLVIFEKTGIPETRLEKINPARVVGNLFPVTMSNYEPAAMGKKFDFLTEFLKSVECYRAYFGTDMDHFAGCMEKLAEKG